MKMYSELDSEGSGCGLFQDTMLEFTWRNWQKPNNPQWQNHNVWVVWLWFRWHTSSWSLFAQPQL